MEDDNLQINSSCYDENGDGEKNENTTKDNITEDNITEDNTTEDNITNDNITEEEHSSESVEEIKCLDLQYFHVQDAPNEIIVTTDGEIDDDEKCEDVEDYTDQMEEAIESIEDSQFTEESIDSIQNSQEGDTSEEKCTEENGTEKKGQVFILPTLADIKVLIKHYCEETSCRFVGQIKTKDFGLSSLECDLSGHRILWQDIPHKNSDDDIITFDGVPHMCVGHYQFGCEFGTDLKASRKEKLQKMKEDGKSEVKTRNVKTPSKKCGCPAKIVVRQIIKFPDFQILKNTEGRKRTGTTKLKESLKADRSKVKTDVLYVGRLPDVSEHKFHELMEGREFSKEMVHPELVIKAQELYLQNKTNLEIYEFIRNHVMNEMFWRKDPPDPKRRRFFPKPIDIRNIVGRIRRLSRFTEEEEENIRKHIEEVRKKHEDVSIFFDTKNELGSNEVKMEENCFENLQSAETFQCNRIKEKKDMKSQQTFIFCYQTHSQQWLIKRYSYLCYCLEVEPNISDIKCALPYYMYCLVIQTNVDYQIVGTIIVSKQRKFGLVEGLRCFREWNMAWDPDYFIIDYSQEIEEAVAAVFPKTTYFLNPESCQRKWKEFLNIPSNDLQEHAEELYVCLESMQYALTEDSLTIFASLLESNEVWKNNDNLRTWFQNSWLHSANKWVFGYRPDDLIIMQHLKTTLDDCLLLYKTALAKSAKTNGCYELILEITNSIAIQEYERYAVRNNELHQFHKHLSQKYTFPEYMQGLQISLYPYAEAMLKVAKANDFIITHDQLGLFTVQLQHQTEIKVKQDTTDNYNHAIHTKDMDKTTKNPDGEEVDENKEVISTKFSYIEFSNKLDSGEFTVSFGDSRSYPFCTCTHWKFYKLPCVHICAVCCRLQGWRYQMFSSLYRSNPVFELDYTCLNNDLVKSESDIDAMYMRASDLLPGNIFESFMKVGANDVVLEQANEFSRQISKMTYLFKNRTLYNKIQQQLTDFVERLKTYLLTKGTHDKLQIPLSTLQSRSDFVALSIVNNMKLNKAIANENCSGGNSENDDHATWTAKFNKELPLPRLQPISKSDPSKYVICASDKPSITEKKALDLVNINISSSETIRTNNTTSYVSPANSRNTTNNGLNGVQSLILGKRFSSITDYSARDDKRLKESPTEILLTKSSSQISIRNNSSKEEAVVNLT